MSVRKLSARLVAIANQNIKEREFWLRELEGDLVKSRFPYDYAEVGAAREKQDTMQITFNRALFLHLQGLSKENNYTLHIILTAALFVLIHKYTDSRDIIVGTPIYKQDKEGEFINTVLALRNQIESNITFKGLLLQVRQTTANSVEHQDYPIELLPEHLDMPSSEKDFPLFDIALLLENIHDRRYIENINTNMTFSFQNTGISIHCRLEYNSSLYRKQTIETILNHFTRLLEHALSNIDLKISEIAMITEAEKKQVLYEFNDTRTDYPKEKTIQRLFEEQVEKRPDGVSTVGRREKVEEIVQITYGELNEKSNQLASLLRNKGVKPGTIVGIIVDRSLEMIIGIIGILKSGGAYLPINPDFPENAAAFMLKDCNASLLLTNSTNIKEYSFTRLQNLQSKKAKPLKTSMRPPILDFDNLPVVDRSLIDYKKYNKYIGHGMVKNSVTLQATRGCPYNCAFCCRVWPRKLVVRSAGNIFVEVQSYYNMGIRRFVFIDDIFNFDIKNSKRFFELVIENNLDIQILFPSGLRGDILTKEFIDLMVKAGTISFPLSLETASPRLQKLIRKNLNLKKFRENIEYIIEKYPHVILELNTMHGLPTETEEEAMMTLDFIKSLKYVHFPYVHILRIHSNTYMEKLALENGISLEAIKRSRDLFYHELPETLPFDKSFTLKYQAEFLNEYFLSKERLLHVLPLQMKVLTEDEIVQKYDSYLPTPINCFSDLLEFANIKEDELGIKGFADEKEFFVPNLDEKIRKHFPHGSSSKNALRLLLLDLSQYYSDESEMLYDVVEQPLGLMYIMSYLNREFGEKIIGKIGKSRIDFNSDEQLQELLRTFKPDVIGLRTLTMYRDFFHNTTAKIRQWGIDVPIIAGGPYATTDYDTLLQDRNIDAAVLGEGEITFAEIIEKIMANDGKLPGEKILKEIKGIAFIPGRGESPKEFCREVVMMDGLKDTLNKEPGENLTPVNRSPDPAYTIFTSGSTGNPKGTLTTHANVIRVVRDTNYIELTENDRILQLSNYAFDGSVFDIYGALLNGAALILIKKEDVFVVDQLAHLLKKEKITLFFLTTALFNTLVDLKIESFDNIKNVLFGGERVSVEHTEKALGHIGKNKIIHVYGPTETTVYATYYPVNEIHEGQQTIPIGKPIANTMIYILARNLMPVPFGVCGQVCIGGPGVATGYLNNPELTSEKFITNPFVKGDRMYLSGDLGRQLPDGNIEFIGRIDQQVKIRGYRIELSEIEKRLLKIDGISQTRVIAREKMSGEKYLCAYFVTHQSLAPMEPRNILGRHLPDFMIPSHFIQVETIPLTLNGKVNRRALPAPEADTGAEYIAPETENEKIIAEIWKDVLELDNVGVDNNFFEVGGTSLDIIRLNSRLKEAFARDIPVVNMFRYPTVSSLAAYLSRHENETAFPGDERVDAIERGKKDRRKRLQKKREAR
jgi:amino acid adenylation domain-containing protein